MSRSLFSLALGALAWLAAGLPASAQLVQVSPGYVRAPFVRVYTGPGGTQVRAPFVDVQSPGYRGRRMVEQPAVPTAEVLSQLDYANLRLAIRELSLYLDGQLSTLSTGDTWKVHLKTAEIRALVQPGSEPPSAELVEALVPILAVFETTAANPAYRTIVGFDGFRSLQNALHELLAAPSERAARQLGYAAGELSRALAQAGAEEGWQRHLALPGTLATGDASPPGTPPASLDEVAQTLARYDAVSQNPQYRPIWQLPAFRVTHERLANYLALSKTEQAARPPIEELPVPR